MTITQDAATETLLTPAEVAALFRVDPKTVTRWARAGKLTSIRTLGGHRRYRASEVQALLQSTTVAAIVDIAGLVQADGVVDLDLASGDATDPLVDALADGVTDLTAAAPEVVSLLPEPRVGS